MLSRRHLNPSSTKTHFLTVASCVIHLRVPSTFLPTFKSVLPQSSGSNLVEALAARGKLEKVHLLLALAAHGQHLAVGELLPAHRLDAVVREAHPVAQLAGAFGAAAIFYL